MLTTRIVAVALAGTAIFAYGCGGSSTSTSTSVESHSSPTHELTETELAAKATAICKSRNEKMTQANAHRRFTEMAPQLASYERAAASELEQLKPPASLASQWERVISGMRTLADNTVQLGAYVNAHQQAAAGALLARSRVVFAHIAAIAKQHGFRVCVQIV